MKDQQQKNVVCIIPARYASTRLPGKPLITVKGLPLIVWTYNRAMESEAFSEVYVATDDERIQDTVREFGGKSIMTSPDHSSGTDRIHEAVQNIPGDYVVNLQGDEPQMPIEILKDFAKNLVKIDTLSLLTCVSNATIEEINDQNVVKAVLAANGEALYFSRASIPFSRDTTNITRYKHVGIYGFSRESLIQFCNLKKGVLEDIEKLEQLRALEQGMRVQCLVRDFTCRSIDTPEDLEAFRLSVEEA